MPEIDLFPAEAVLSQVPISEVSAFLSAYSSIKSMDAWRIFLAPARAVGESLNYSFLVDIPKSIKKMNAS